MKLKIEAHVGLKVNTSFNFEFHVSELKNCDVCIGSLEFQSQWYVHPHSATLFSMHYHIFWCAALITNSIEADGSLFDSAILLNGLQDSI